MCISFKKGILMILAAGSIVIFASSCKPAPTKQPWDIEKGAGTPVKTTEPSATEDKSPTPEPTLADVTVQYVTMDKLKETTQPHLKATLQMKECKVSIDTDILVRTREPKSCPIYQVEPFKYNMEEILKLIYGKNIDDALAYDKANPKPAELPELHRYRSGNVVANVENSSGSLNMGIIIPRFTAVAEEDAKDPIEAKVIPTGICDTISFSGEEAKEMASSYIEPFKFPVDLTLPQVKAYQWHNFQYYEITFEHLYGEISAYTNNKFATSLNVNICESVMVQVSQDGVFNLRAQLEKQIGTEAETDKVIDFDTAYGLFKKYLSDRLTQLPAPKVDFSEIEFAYFPVLPKEYDGSHWQMVPCWIFFDTNSNFNIVISGLDGSVVKVNQ